MNMIKCMCATALSMLATGIVCAETTTLAYDSSPLTPGARIVAGDLSKNEFFILGKDEQPKVRSAANQPHEVKATSLVPQIKTALNKTLKPIQTEKTSRVAANTYLRENKLAMNQELQQSLRQLRKHYAKNSSNHKMTYQKNHLYSFKSHQPTHHYRVANKHNTHHRQHLALANKPHYKFASLTQHRLRLKNQAALHSQRHPIKRVAVAKL